MDDDGTSGETDAGRVAARRSALKKLGAGAAAVWVAPAIATGASAGQVASPAPGTCVGTEAELLAALAAATARTTITLCATTISLSSTVVIDTDVVLVSAGPGRATLSGSTADLLQIEPGTAVTLDNITVTGRGIANGGTLTLTGCLVDDAADGPLPAIRSNGVLSATSSTFSNNATTTAGGAISTSGGTLTLTNCTFTGNSATDGGAVRIADTAATITNGLFSANAAIADGGAIFASGSSAFSTPGSTFVANNADPALGAGGAVRHAASGLYTVGSATFTGNLAGIGTAIYRGTNPISLAGATFGPGQTVVNP